LNINLLQNVTKLTSHYLNKTTKLLLALIAVWITDQQFPFRPIWFTHQNLFLWFNSVQAQYSGQQYTIFIT